MKRKKASMLGTAALMEIISRAQSTQAAVLRGAPEAELEILRREAHDLVDSYLDHMTDAARHTREIIEP
nr:hypothetical protein [Brevundimonas naejangsanensis]